MIHKSRVVNGMPARISTFAEKAKELISLRSFPVNWNAKKTNRKIATHNYFYNIVGSNQIITMV